MQVINITNGYKPIKLLGQHDLQLHNIETIILIIYFKINFKLDILKDIFIGDINNIICTYIGYSIEELIGFKLIKEIRFHKVIDNKFNHLYSYNTDSLFVKHLCNNIYKLDNNKLSIRLDLADILHNLELENGKYNVTIIFNNIANEKIIKPIQNGNDLDIKVDVQLHLNRDKIDPKMISRYILDDILQFKQNYQIDNKSVIEFSKVFKALNVTQAIIYIEPNVDKFVKAITWNSDVDSSYRMQESDYFRYVVPYHYRDRIPNNVYCIPLYDNIKCLNLKIDIDNSKYNGNITLYVFFERKLIN